LGKQSNTGQLAPFLDVSVQVLQIMPEDHSMFISIENNNDSSTNIGYNANDEFKIVNNPINEVMDFFKQYMKIPKKKGKNY